MIKNLTVAEYAILYTEGNLAQMLEFAKNEMDNEDVQREVPKIWEALQAKRPLDPEPWARFPDKENGGARFAKNEGGYLYWNPRPEYSQNLEDYR